jgi:hypothetical protein
MICSYLGLIFQLLNPRRYVHIFGMSIHSTMLCNEFGSKLAKKRWNTYLKEENRNNKTFEANSKYLGVIAIIILSAIKFIIRIIENIQPKRKHKIEKVYVE